MSLVALLPLAVFVVGAIAIAVMAARAAYEAEQLWAEIRRVHQLRPVLAEIGDEGRRLRAALAYVRR